MKCEACDGQGSIPCSYCDGTGEAVTAADLLQAFSRAETLDDWRVAFAYTQHHIRHVCPDVRDPRRLDIVHAWEDARERIQSCQNKTS